MNCVAVADGQLDAVVQIGRVNCHPSEIPSLVAPSIMQILRSTNVDPMHSLSLVQYIYLIQVHLDIRYSQFGHIQESAVDQAHHPRIECVLQHQNLEVCVIFARIDHAVGRVGT